MSIFGARRSRQTRVFRPSQSIWEKLNSSLKDYRVLTQLLIAALAIVLLLVAMHSWRATFPYRIGHFVPYGVMSRVAFNVEN
jgi:hypothetical protein